MKQKTSLRFRLYRAHRYFRYHPVGDFPPHWREEPYQFIRVEADKGKAILNGKEHGLEDGSAVVIPAGTQHNIVNSSPSEFLKLYTISTPPEHPEGTVHKDKAAALAYEKAHHH
jgi:mannose-6-phosphate isomerase-like protein (cupin superfamily)